MTPEELRAVDAQVAEALGWHWDDDWGCLIPPEQTAKPDEMWTDWEYDADTGECWVKPIKEHHISGVVYNGDFTKVVLPHYTTDDNTAGTLLDAMRDDGLTVQRLATGGILGDQWQCHVADVWRQVTREGDRDYFANAETRALAVCLVFLKTKCRPPS